MKLDRMGKVLIADTSAVARALVARLLRPYAEEVVEAASLDEARERLALAGLSLLVVDISGDEFTSLLADIEELELKPAVLALTSRPRLEEETDLTMRGAIGYLSKPVSLRKILRALWRFEEPTEPVSPRIYLAPVARALVIDPDTKVAQVSWDVWDMSSGGALVGSQSFLPVGTRLELLLILDDDEVPVDAEVVRIQEPTWAVVPGAGVVFHYPSASERQRIETFIAGRLDPA